MGLIDLGNIDRDIAQPLGRLLHDAFDEGLTTIDPTSGTNTIYTLMDAGTNWTSGNCVGVRAKATTDTSSGYVGSLTGLWAGLVRATGYAASNAGLQCAINAEVETQVAAGGAPNAILYLQSLPGALASHATMPYIVFSETAAGTGSNILFEVGHVAAGTTCTSGDGKLFDLCTLQIKVNGTALYIPLSTVEKTFTTAYPISSTYSAGNAVLVTTTTGTTGLTDIALASTYTGTAHYESHVGANFTVTYTPAAGTGSCWVESLGGKVNVNGTIDAQTWFKGVGANLNFSASADFNAASSIACAITASITSDASAVVQDGNIAVIHLSCASANVDLTDTAGICTFIYIDNDSQHAVGGMDSIMRVHSWDTPYLFDFPSGGYSQGIQDTGGTAGASCVGHLKILFNGATAYLNVFSDNS